MSHPVRDEMSSEAWPVGKSEREKGNYLKSDTAKKRAGKTGDIAKTSIPQEEGPSRTSSRNRSVKRELRAEEGIEEAGEKKAKVSLKKRAGKTSDIAKTSIPKEEGPSRTSSRNRSVKRELRAEEGIEEAGEKKAKVSLKKRAGKTDDIAKKRIPPEAKSSRTPLKRLAKRERAQEEGIEEAGEKKAKVSLTNPAATTDSLPNRMKNAVAPLLRRTASVSDMRQADLNLEENKMAAMPKVSGELMRQAELNRAENKKAAMAKVSGEIWECFDRTPGPHGGFLYHFRGKPEFEEEDTSAQWDKLTEMFPATEPLVYPKGTRAGVGPVELDENLNALGYSYDGKTGVLVLPDLQALRNGWKALQSENPYLLDLDIVSSEGIADDISFSKSHLMHDALLSTGKEFVHDHSFHVISAIKLLLSCGNPAKSGEYQKARVKHVMTILRCLRRLDWATKILQKSWPKDQDEVVSNKVHITRGDISKLERSLGAAVDLSSAADNFTDLEKELENFQSLPHMLYSDEFWKNARRRWYGETEDESHLEQVWKELGRLEKVYMKQI